MKRSRSPSRRDFLESAAAGTLGVGVAGCAPARDVAVEGPTPADRPRDCNPTPSNALGPYHREEAPERAAINPNGDEGERLVILGTVTGFDCPDPIGVVDVDVWHCDVQGDYDNDSDAFAFRGRLQTDADGDYRVETLLPGRYLDGDEFRPRHVHFLFVAPGHEPLTTQLYFEDDEFNEVDRLFDAALARPLVGDGAGGWTVTFDVVLTPQ